MARDERDNDVFEDASEGGYIIMDEGEELDDVKTPVAASCAVAETSGRTPAPLSLGSARPLEAEV